MTCLHRERQFLVNGDYYREQIKLPRVYGLEIMGKGDGEWRVTPRRLCGSCGQAVDRFGIGDGRGHRGCLTETLCFPGLEGVGQ